MSFEKMPMPSRKRALELGAALIEADLGKMRMDARRRDSASQPGGQVYPVTHCLEHDLMKASEWAAAAATLWTLSKLEEK